MVPLHGLQFGISWTWGVGLSPVPLPCLVTQVPMWALLGPGESGPYLFLSQIRGLWSPPGTHLDLITLLHTLASPGPDDSGPHLGLNLDLVTVVPPGSHLDLVTLVPT